MQLTVVGGGTVQTAWLNTETGDTFTTKPVGFVTGTCQDAALADVLKFSATAPTASAPFAAPKDGDTTIVTSDGTEAGDVVGLFLYDAETSTWKEIPVKTDILWTDVATAPAATGNPVGPRFEITTEGAKYFIDSDGRAEKLDTKIDVNLTPIDYIPAPTGNADNRGEIVVDPAGGVWVIDEEGDAIQLSLPTFKELNRFYVDPNGNDSNTGANEAPKLTAQAAVDALTANDTAVLNEGTYAAVTMSVQNTALAGASSTYGSLSQIAAVTVATASGTSNKISDLTVTGNLARTGNAPLYVNNTTVGGNVTLAGTAYTEIRDSSIQDGGIAVSGAATVLIEDSKIGTSTFSTAGSAIAMRNTTIDATDTVTYGPGVVYSLQDAVGNIVLDPAAVNAEDALIAAGVPAAQAEGAVTSHFMHIRMHNADVELNPTQIVTRDPVTGELEYSPLSAIAPAAEATSYGTAAPTSTTGNTAGDTYFVTPLGTSADAANATEAYRWDGTQWVKLPGGSSASSTLIHERDVVLATAGMTSHTLPDTPVGKVIVTRNGADISDSWSFTGAVGTYTPATNYGCVIDANDKLEFHYEKEGTAGGESTSCRPKVKVVTANYTLTAADEGYMIYASSATPITITAPAGMPAGFIAEIYQEGAGQVTVAGGAGNTLRSANGFKTRVQHSAIGISYQTTALSNVIGDSTV
jgi:hypothetical protein